ncbi:MAG: hydroxymethylbilane synthase [Chitinophagales bacterium]
MKSKSLRIGTRDSLLAIWQAEKVQNLLKASGINSELVFIKSYGDQVQDKALHQLGGTGVFTKALDDALLDNQIDIAVHSCKDVPTLPAPGIHIGAYLEREDHRDVLVCKSAAALDESKTHQIATGSLRRKAQWLQRFPKDQVHNLRGNVQTRLKKLKDNNWFGAVFAWAGLKRLNIRPDHYIMLDWMLSAPAQGIVVAACREKDTETKEKISAIDNKESRIQATAERKFLNLMEGGCTAPIGAYAEISGDLMKLKVQVNSIDGQEFVKLDVEGSKNEPELLAEKAYKAAKAEGAVEIVRHIKL